MSLIIVQGYKVFIDHEDYARLSKYTWCVHKEKAVVTSVPRGNGTHKETTMQEIILDYYGPLLIDHMDRNPFNNQKENLRLATYQQNRANSKRQSNNTGKYKGVKKARNGKFEARIICNGRYLHLGTYEKEEEAARAYDYHALQFNGEFAFLNFP